MKKVLLFMFLFIIVFISACTSPSPTKAPDAPEISVFQEAQDGRPIRFAHGQHGDTWMGLMLAGFLEACDDYGLLCDHSAVAGLDEAPVISYVEQMNSENTSGLMMGMWYESRYILAEYLDKKGVPLVSPHVQLPAELNGLGLAGAGPDVDGYALAAGRAMAEKVNCEGPVAFSQSSLLPQENQVTEGFQTGFRELCPDTEFLEKIAIGPTDTAKAIALAGAELTAHPDVVAAMSSTAHGGMAWAKAAEENGKEPGEIVIQGMDGMPANLDLVKSGEIWVLIGQPVYEEAYYSVVLLVNNLMGFPVPYKNLLPAPQITIDNVDDFYEIVEKAQRAALGE